jgi:hypothetical protein
MDQPDAFHSLVKGLSEVLLLQRSLINEVWLLDEILEQVPKSCIRGVGGTDVDNEGIPSELAPDLRQLVMRDELGVGKYVNVHMPALSLVGDLDAVEAALDDPFEATEEGFHTGSETRDTLSCEMAIVHER